MTPQKMFFSVELNIHTKFISYWLTQPSLYIMEKISYDIELENGSQKVHDAKNGFKQSISAKKANFGIFAW